LTRSETYNLIDGLTPGCYPHQLFHLLQDTKPARFATCAADTHELDFFPNAKVIEAGLSWLPDPEIDWRSIPNLAEERANWERRASHLITWQSDDHANTSSPI
jgi:hypothetical protein